MATAEERMRCKIAKLVKQRDAIPDPESKGATLGDLAERARLFDELNPLYAKLDALLKQRALRPVAGKAG